MTHLVWISSAVLGWGTPVAAEPPAKPTAEAPAAAHFPGKDWQVVKPEDEGLDLAELAAASVLAQPPAKPSDPKPPPPGTRGDPDNVPCIGKTDPKGNTVTHEEVNAANLFATIYAALGINPHKNYYVGSRPIPLADPGSEPVAALIK